MVLSAWYSYISLAYIHVLTIPSLVSCLLLDVKERAPNQDYMSTRNFQFSPFSLDDRFVSRGIFGEFFLLVKCMFHGSPPNVSSFKCTFFFWFIQRRP